LGASGDEASILSLRSDGVKQAVYGSTRNDGA
jgi:hypothetical protein